MLEIKRLLTVTVTR